MINQSKRKEECKKNECKKSVRNFNNNREMKRKILVSALIIMVCLQVFGLSPIQAQFTTGRFLRGKSLFGTGIAARKPISPSKLQRMFGSNGRGMLKQRFYKDKGRAGRYPRLKEIMMDPKTARRHKGWLKNEFARLKKGRGKSVRMPKGMDLAHPHGMEASKGFDHRFSKLQDRDLHRTQHKIDKGGKLQKTQAKALAELTKK